MELLVRDHGTHANACPALLLERLLLIFCAVACAPVLGSAAAEGLTPAPCFAEEASFRSCCCEPPLLRALADRLGGARGSSSPEHCWQYDRSWDACCRGSEAICQAARARARAAPQDCFTSEEHFNLCCCWKSADIGRGEELYGTALQLFRQCFWGERSQEACCVHLMSNCDQMSVRVSSTAEYWEARYLSGGSSTDLLSRSKTAPAMYLYRTYLLKWLFDKELGGVTSVLDFGVGDGNQAYLLLREATFLEEYVGVDVSRTAVKLLQASFAEALSSNNVFRGRRLATSFYAYDGTALPRTIVEKHFDVAMSMQVIMHLLEDKLFLDYMAMLFEPTATWRHVVIHADNVKADQVNHMRGWRFTDWVPPAWRLTERPAQQRVPAGYVQPDLCGSSAHFTMA